MGKKEQVPALRKRKVLGTLCFPFCLPENLVQANGQRRLGALGVQSLTAHPGPVSSEAHPAGRMIGIGLRAREP